MAENTFHDVILWFTANDESWIASAKLIVDLIKEKFTDISLRVVVVLKSDDSNDDVLKYIVVKNQESGVKAFLQTAITKKLSLGPSQQFGIALTVKTSAFKEIASTFAVIATTIWTEKNVVRFCVFYGFQIYNTNLILILEQRYYSYIHDV